MATDKQPDPRSRQTFSVSLLALATIMFAGSTAAHGVLRVAALVLGLALLVLGIAALRSSSRHGGWLPSKDADRGGPAT